MDTGWTSVAVVPSPIFNPSGNREFLICLIQAAQHRPCFASDQQVIMISGIRHGSGPLSDKETYDRNRLDDFRPVPETGIGTN